MNHNGIWMPLFIGDYLRDTIGLTKAEHGSYLLAIMKYWSKGESLTGGELKEVAGREMNRVCQFFVCEGGRWHHKRIDQELASTRERLSKAKEKAKAAALARWSTQATSNPTPSA